MKEKRSKKESNKEEAKKEGRNVTVFASFSEAAAPQEYLKIDWPSFIRFFNAAPKPDASRKRFAKNSANGARKGHAEPSATRNTSE